MVIDKLENVKNKLDNNLSGALKMVRIRARGEEIRRYILENIENHPNDISKVTADHFKITRQAVNLHLHKLTLEKTLTTSGATRNHSYKLAPLVEWRRTYEITPDLSEGDVWAKDIKLVLGQQPENVTDIWQYGFTEMFNNAKDHSESPTITVLISKTAMLSEMAITDSGIGIFRKIQQALNLVDERHAILELAKGKFTTDPNRHTGEGIFFTSRMFDSFDILSGNCFFTHKIGTREDFLLEAQGGIGTYVWMNLSNHTCRTSKEIFDQYSSGEDYGFTKTVVPVKLAEYGDDKLISRSQAKRVLSRVELFQTVMLDFEGLDTIGQSFADEIFRVFQNQHPQVHLIPINMSENVGQMVRRALIDSQIYGLATPGTVEPFPVKPDKQPD
jgi:anti-sigma regulatory factor (Ser/Thr protein kinase)